MAEHTGAQDGDLSLDRSRRTRGIVFTPAEVQFEGLHTVLDRLSGIGANAVAITPGVFVPGTSENGVREPPLDVEGAVRELDRPLWGSKGAHVQRFSPYAADPAIWRDVPFSPPVLAPPEHRVDVTRDLIDETRLRGMDAFVILSPTVIPGLPGGHSMSGGIASGAPDERPLPIGGVRSDRIIAGQGCPNNERVRSLVIARVREAIHHYGDAAGFLFDWVEYTCYFPEDAFTCVCSACQREAARLGFDWESITGAVRAMWDRLHALTDDDLRRVRSAGSLDVLLPVAHMAALAEFGRFKALSVARLFELIIETVRRSDAPHLSVGASGFPPPWSAVTGSEFRTTAPHVDKVRPKFFTFHWAMMVRWYGESIRAWNPHLDERLVVTALLAVFGLSGGHQEHRRLLTDYGMPAPTEPHPLTATDLRRKLEQVVSEVDGQARVEGYVHSYQPAETFGELVHAIEDTDVDGMWIQRYGYLSEEKLDILGESWRLSARTVAGSP